MVGMPAEIPRREPLRCQLGLAVPRGHQQHEPVNLATLNALELLGYLLVVRCGLILGERVFSERYQARPGLSA
jgi:hypothetical protein